MIRVTRGFVSRLATLYCFFDRRLWQTCYFFVPFLLHSGVEELLLMMGKIPWRPPAEWSVILTYDRSKLERNSKVDCHSRRSFQFATSKEERKLVATSSLLLISLSRGGIVWLIPPSSSNLDAMLAAKKIPSAIGRYCQRSSVHYSTFCSNLDKSPLNAHCAKLAAEKNPDILQFDPILIWQIENCPNLTYTRVHLTLREQALTLHLVCWVVYCVMCSKAQLG